MLTVMRMRSEVEMQMWTGVERDWDTGRGMDMGSGKVVVDCEAPAHLHTLMRRAMR